MKLRQGTLRAISVLIFLIGTGALSACASPQAVTSTAGGYELAGYSPRGPYRVTVDANLGALVGDVEYTTSRLRAITGVDIRYVGTPSGPLASGEIRVVSAAVCIPYGIACAQPYLGFDGYTDNAVITVTSSAYGHNLRTIILHEFGHVFGLGHYDGTWQGRTQVMNSGDGWGDDYEAGDIAGLRAAVGR